MSGFGVRLAGDKNIRRNKIPKRWADIGAQIFLFHSVSAHRRPIVPICYPVEPKFTIFNAHKHDNTPNMLWMRQRKQQPSNKKSECIAKCLYTHTRYTLVTRGATIKADEFIFRFAHDFQCCVNLIVDVLQRVRRLASFVQANQNSESCSMRLHHLHQTLAAFRLRHEEKIPQQSQSEWETPSRTGIEIARRMAAKNGKHQTYTRRKQLYCL